MTPMMLIDVGRIGDQGETRVALVGDLDNDGGNAARRQLKRIVEAGNVNLTIDLDRVDTLESGGLAALIATLRLARDRGGNVRVQTTKPHIRRVMELTGLSRVFRLPTAGQTATTSAA